MNRIKLSKLASIVLALSMLLYALRGKYGAILITLEAILVLIIIFKQKSEYRSRVSMLAAIVLFVFAFVIHYFRSKSPEFYLIVGYLTAAVIMLETKEDHYKTLWQYLKGIALLEASGIFIQLLVPGLYYNLMSILLSNEMIASIKFRYTEGYYTGFSHEVSYTMFLIVTGLGLYLYDGTIQNKTRKWCSILFLFAALIVSGKRATLVFFIAAFLLTQFIKSDSKIKVLKYTFLVVAGITFAWLSYPWWSKIPAFSRVNKLIMFFSINDFTGMTSGRTLIYADAIKLWNTNRWFGIGWGNFKYSISPKFWYSGYDVHNCFLQILCETGIIGFIFYMIIIFFSIVNGVKGILIYRHDKNGRFYNLAVYCCYLQIFFILYSLSEPILYEYTDYVIYFLCFNCSNILVRKRKIKAINLQRFINRVIRARKNGYGQIAG